MKMIRKIAALLLAVCLVVPCVSMITHAADGSIQFTDPSTKAGETVEVTCAVKANSGSVEDVELTITYDTSMLKFKSGSGVTEATAGTLKYEGTGNSATLRFTITFDALKEGTTKIEVSDYKAFLSTDEALNCQKGYATVTIAEGDGTTQPPAATTAGTLPVTVNGVEYTLADTIPTTVIPLGFTETTLELESGQRKFLKQASSGMYLGYLLDAENNGSLFIYNESDATFSPFELIEISTTTYIILLSDASAITMPEEYQKMDLTVNGQAYPAWQHVENPANYILYAINSDGEMSLYQYDSQEGTYQRIETPEVVEEVVDESFMGKFRTFVDANFTYAVLIAGLALLFFLVLIIVLGVKLCNRNRELDELYDEYEIDLDVEEMETKKQAEKQAALSRKEEEDEDEDEGLSLEGFRYEEDDFEINFEDALEKQLNEEPEEKEQVKTMKEESSFEDFDLDFIDLDD